MMLMKTPKTKAVTKMERQPAYCVNIPPTKGPTAKPKYTADTEIPSTRPRYCGANEETIMAAPVALVNDAPIPCTKRKNMNQEPDGIKLQTKDESVNSNTPHLKIRLHSA